MSQRSERPLLDEVREIYRAAAAMDDGETCMVAPSPELSDRIEEELEKAAKGIESAPGAALTVREPDAFGLNDGLIIPGTEFPLGTPPATIRSAAADRSPLRGTLRVLVVLADFSDEEMTATTDDIERLFFSLGEIPTGSVREYYQEVSHGQIDLEGEVVGPCRLPETLATYANGTSGRGPAPNARTMARDAAEAADSLVDYSTYDVDGNGYVDAFVVVHAGTGAETSGSGGDIWSLKSVLAGGPYVGDGTNVYAFMTVPEDARIGVCAHELGHLIFGYIDLYDPDRSSSGIGNWCLMGSGSWNGGGNRPAHPSAWCKKEQDWATVANQTANATATISDVKSSHTVHRLWKNGDASQEYFLVENRQKTGYDDHLPGEGLLIWHIDEAVANNADERHPKVGLEQADGEEDLQARRNRGDAGDPYPGSSGNRTFDKDSTPSSRSYAGADTCVAVTDISDSGPTMTARLAVRCRVKLFKEAKELKKERIKDRYKDQLKERLKEHKDKEAIKEIPDVKLRPEKPVPDKYLVEDPLRRLRGFEPRIRGAGQSDLEARVEALENQLGQAQPFISSELRPDLSEGAYAGEEDVSHGDQELLEDRFEKRLLDVPPAIG